MRHPAQKDELKKLSYEGQPIYRLTQKFSMANELHRPILKLGFVGFLLIWNDSEQQTLRDDLLNVNDGLVPLDESTILFPNTQFMALLERPKPDGNKKANSVTVRSCFRVLES